MNIMCLLFRHRFAHTRRCDDERQVRRFCLRCGQWQTVVGDVWLNGRKHSAQLIAAYTPMTERWVQGRLAATYASGLAHADNVRAYGWRMRELRCPFFTKLIGLFVFGPRVAFGWPK